MKKNKTRILIIGDPHGELEKIKKISIKNIDLILLTGDLGSASLMRKMYFDNVKRKQEGLTEIKYTNKEEKAAYMEAYNSTMNIIKYLSKFSPIFTIFGNVENSNYETRKISKEIGEQLPILSNDLNKIKNVRVINNRIANFNGIKIGGLNYFVDTNWVEDFKPDEYDKKLKIANKGTNKAKKILDWFSKIDILLTHQPPYNILDKVTAPFAPKYWQGKHAGSKSILNYIKSKNPKFVFCGHIHEGKGYQKVKSTEVYNLGVAGHKIIEI